MSGGFYFYFLHYFVKIGYVLNLIKRGLNMFRTKYFESTNRLGPLELDRPIKVGCWNVWYRSKPQKVLDKLIAMDCDILLLQEVGCREGGRQQAYDLPTQIHQALDMSGYWVENRTMRYRKGMLHEGQAVYSRFPAIFNDHYLNSGGRAPGKSGEASRRIVVEGHVPLGEIFHGITFLSLHRSYTLPFGLNRDQLDTEDSELLNLLVSKNGLVVAAGDLNVQPNSEAVRYLAAAVPPVGPDCYIPSWVGPPRFSWLIGAFGQHKRIDHAFSDIKVVSAEFGDQGPSDHRPLIFEIDHRVKILE